MLARPWPIMREIVRANRTRTGSGIGVRSHHVGLAGKAKLPLPPGISVQP